MGNLMATLNPHRVFARVTLYHLIYFYYVQKVSTLCYRKKKIASDLKGVSISRGGPKITHLFFADDSFLFCKATTGDVNRIQGILTQYEKASSQQINRQKTTIFFSKSTPHSAQAAIQDMLGVPTIK